MRSLAIVAAVLLSSGSAHANGTSIAAWRQWCQETIDVLERRADWTNGARRCLNYIHGARDMAAGVSGRSPICYRESEDTGDTLVYQFVSWADRHPEKSSDHIAYGVMATIMEKHACR